MVNYGQDNRSWNGNGLKGRFMDRAMRHGKTFSGMVGGVMAVLLFMSLTVWAVLQVYIIWYPFEYCLYNGFSADSLIALSGGANFVHAVIAPALFFIIFVGLFVFKKNRLWTFVPQLWPIRHWNESNGKLFSASYGKHVIGESRLSAVKQIISAVASAPSPHAAGIRLWSSSARSRPRHTSVRRRDCPCPTSFSL